VLIKRAVRVNEADERGINGFGVLFSLLAELSRSFEHSDVRVDETLRYFIIYMACCDDLLSDA